MSGFTVLSVILSVLALLGTSPFWVSTLLYYKHRPEIYPYFVEERRGSDSGLKGLEELDEEANIEWSQITGEGTNMLNFKNNSEIPYSVDIIFTTEMGWDLRQGSQQKIDQRGMGKEGFWYKIDNINNTGHLPQGTSAFRFPFEKPTNREEMEGTITMTVNPEVDLEEFGFPRFFGSTQLEPIEREFHFSH